MRHVTEPDQHRLFASTKFTLERIAPAAAHCAIALPDQHRHRHADLRQTWQSRITCTHTPYLGRQFDVRFTEDQAFTLSPVQLTILEQREAVGRDPDPGAVHPAQLSG